MKLSKTKQVIWGLVGGFFLIGTIAVATDDSKETKDTTNTEQKESKTIAENTITQKAIDEAPVEASEPAGAVLFETSNDFRTSFNNFCESIDVDMRLSKPELNEGEVNNTFKASVSDHIYFIGTLNKADNTVKEITMIGGGDGTTASGANIILAMGSLVGTMEPSLTGKERINVLKKMGLMSDEDVLNLSKTYDHNGLHYSLSSSPQMGFWFSVAKQ